MHAPVAQSNPETVLELESVHVPSMSRPEVEVLRGVNWRVTQGERWLVSGPQGCGRSSLVGVAAGLLRPPGGVQRLFGEDLARLTEGELSARRRRVGVVFGGGGRLFQHLSVAENVALPLAYHAASLGADDLAERVGTTLASLGLEAWADRRPVELTRRLAQRVALARALILAPEVLLLDDPWSGLPRSEPEWWREQFERIEGIGPVRTWVVVAADAGPWEGWADRFAHMEVRRWQVMDREEPEEPEEPLEPGVASSNS